MATVKENVVSNQIMNLNVINTKHELIYCKDTFAGLILCRRENCITQPGGDRL